MRVTVGILAGLGCVCSIGCNDFAEPAQESSVGKPLIVTSESTVRITNLTVESDKAYQVAEGAVSEGSRYYVDRSYELRSPIPRELDGLTLIKTAKTDSKAEPGSSSFLTFDVDRDATVYVAHDNAAKNPQWLDSGFEDTGEDLLTTDQGRSFSIFRRQVPKGRVVLGSNVTSGWGGAMYVVAVGAAPGGGSESPSPAEDPPPSGTHAGYYVATTGSASGDGSVGKPWNLTTLLNHPGSVHPGDTVWVRGGTYSTEDQTSLLNGTPAAPIIVRAYPGEQVRWDGGLGIRGSNTWYWGLEFFFSGWSSRRSNAAGSWPSDIPGPLTSVNVFGPGVKFINCIVHDLGEGFDFWTEAVDGELDGNLVFNNGWSGPDRGHGHGIYTQNAGGTKRITNNIIFNNFGNGIQAYGSSAATVRGYYFEGNASFGNGSVGDEGLQMNYIIGGGSPAEAITFTRNYGYHTVLSGGGARVGWGVVNRDVSFTDNVIVGETAFYGWQAPQVTGNVFVGENTMMQLVLPNGGGTGSYRWTDNAYYRADDRYQPFSYVSGSSSKGLQFSEWRSSLGLDGGSSFVEGRPTGNQVIVRPSKYEKGRGIIIAYDWSRSGSITADLSKVLAPGQAYEVRSAQNPSGPAVSSGRYAGGSLTLSTAGLAPVQPLGSAPNRAVATGPEFSVFLVVPR